MDGLAALRAKLPEDRPRRIQQVRPLQDPLAQTEQLETQTIGRPALFTGDKPVLRQRFEDPVDRRAGELQGVAQLNGGYRTRAGCQGLNEGEGFR